MSVDYAEWLDRIADATTDDVMWALFDNTPPPEQPLACIQIRERLIAVLGKRGVRAPAKAADAWLDSPLDTSTGGCGGPEPRAQVHKPPELASEDDILTRLTWDLRALGHVGEERACKLIYLATTSRLLEQIVSIVAKGPSAAGKSATVDRVLTFFPEEATVALSGMSEKFLVYDDRPIKHRMLVLHEAAGMSGEYASYLVRTLLSEGCLRHGTVESTANGLRPVMVEREGPAGLITTNGRVTLIHPRVWPALVRLADRFPSERLAAVDEEHTESGAHRTTEIPFPDWVPVEVITAARLLSVEEALALLPACLR
jgi:hypothetical protein